MGLVLHVTYVVCRGPEPHVTYNSPTHIWDLFGGGGWGVSYDWLRELSLVQDSQLDIGVSQDRLYAAVSFIALKQVLPVGRDSSTVSGHLLGKEGLEKGKDTNSCIGTHDCIDKEPWERYG